MLTRRDYFEFFATATLILLLYGLLHGIYRYNNIDDSWTLSYSYNYCQAGITQDWRIGGESISMNNPGGLLSFGRVSSWVQCHFLDWTGWSREHGHSLSSIFTYFTALLWFLIARHLSLSTTLSVTFAFSLLLYEPIFQLANQSRSDFFVMFLVSFAVYCWQSRFYMAAGLLSLLAIETHPLGIMSGVYIAAIEVTQWRTWHIRNLVYKMGWFILGTLPVILAYVLIYNDEVHYLFQLMGQYQQKGFSSFLLSYFLHATGYEYRHLPELFIILIAMVLFIHHRLFISYPAPFIMIIFVVIASFMLKRDNFHYMIYAAPALLLLTLLSFAHHWGRGKYLILFLLYFTPQYLFVFYQNHHNQLATLDMLLKDAVPIQADIVFGDANSWITFKDRNYYHLKNIRHAYVQLERYQHIYAISRDSVTQCGFPESKACLEMRGFLDTKRLQFEPIKAFQWGREHYSVYRVHLLNAAPRNASKSF